MLGVIGLLLGLEPPRQHLVNLSAPGAPVLRQRQIGQEGISGDPDGVPLEAAQGMIVLAFLAEALEEIENEDLSEEIRASIAVWALGGAEL